MSISAGEERKPFDRRLSQSTEVRSVDIDSSIGLALKQAQYAYRAEMDSALRDIGLSVPQYACLEQISQRPGISHAELARATFVTRQAVHQLLGRLRTTGFIKTEGQGRGERLALTAVGTRRLKAASTAIAAIEDRMIVGIDPKRREQFHSDLIACIAALQGSHSQS